MVGFHGQDPIKLQLALAEVQASQADFMTKITQVSETIASFAVASQRVADSLVNLSKAMGVNTGDKNGE